MKKRWLLICAAAFSFMLSACGSFLVPAGDTVPAVNLGEKAQTDVIAEAPPAAEREELKLAVPTEVTVFHLETLQSMTQYCRDVSLVLFPAEAVGGQESLLASGLYGFDLLLADIAVLRDLVPEMGASGEPFRFRDLTEARAFMESEEQEEAEEKLKEYGLRVLGYTDNGFRVMSNSLRPIEQPEDLNGLRIAVPTFSAFSESLQELGAEAVELPLENLYPGLQTGAVDGQESFLPLYEELRLYEVQHYLTVTNHVYGGMCLLIREESWNALPEIIQEELAMAAEKALSEDQKGMEAELERILSGLEAKGMHVSRPECFSGRN
ncbi:MAG: TRAP transporter substrate-binding protein DctP [Oscillospiraceae bacterium]|nr:TRAP transporter substrate-binding protein DctP [Oscillospiraceae bacterium]